MKIQELILETGDTRLVSGAFETIEEAYAEKERLISELTDVEETVRKDTPGATYLMIRQSGLTKAIRKVYLSEIDVQIPHLFRQAYPTVYIVTAKRDEATEVEGYYKSIGDAFRSMNRLIDSDTAALKDEGLKIEEERIKNGAILKTRYSQYSYDIIPLPSQKKKSA